MNIIEYILAIYGSTILEAILCAIFTAAAYWMKKWLNDDTKRAVAKDAARFVEQVWNTLHGPDKLQKALEKAEALLKKKGIPFDAEEMETLIEAAVAEFNKAFEK